MSTFTDMTTLLLTFFILMFTTAEVDGQKLRLILSAFSGSLGVLSGGGMSLEESSLKDMGLTVESRPASKPEDSQLNIIHHLAQRYLESIIQEGKITVVHDTRGIVISINGTVFYDIGSYEITSLGKAKLDRIGEFFSSLILEQNISKQVFIEGYSSQESYRKDSLNVWRKNLHLASMRAETVMMYLVEKILDYGITPTFFDELGNQKSRFVLQSYGNFQQTESNNTPEERAWNRRVDLVIKKN